MLLSIGDLARQTHETVKTLRYWSDKRLLRAERGENGYRYFPAEMVQRVTFIRSAQAMGFSLNDIRAILELRQNGVTPCDHVRIDLDEQLASVQARIATLQVLEQELSERLAWAVANPAPDCDTEGCVYLLDESP